jgi:2-polyprenyl-3-methyl-5-hydroxy-6-metoxy-1,4-benzoquinol methylase
MIARIVTLLGRFNRNAVLDDASQGGRIDIGAGHDVFLEEWRRVHRESHVAAIEPSPEMTAICRGNGIEVLEAMAGDVAAWHGKADLLVCFEVIEHIHDAERFASVLQNC